MRQQVLGEFENQNQSSARSLELSFNISRQPCSHDWYKNHINSTFMADYAGQVVNDLNPDISPQLSTLNDTVNFVANELLEQAMLCRDGTSDSEIRIAVRISDTNIRLYIKNRVNADNIEVLTDKLTTILSEDPAVRYIQQLQSGQESTGDDLRYLSMMVDHEVDIAWKIEHADNSTEDSWVTTMTSVPIQQSHKLAI